MQTLQLVSTLCLLKWPLSCRVQLNISMFHWVRSGRLPILLLHDVQTLIILDAAVFTVFVSGGVSLNRESLDERERIRRLSFWSECQKFTSEFLILFCGGLQMGLGFKEFLL